MLNNIKRLQLEKLRSSVLSNNNRDVLLIQGARQVGKTTLIEQALAPLNPVYALNFERDLDTLREIDRSDSFDEFTRILRLRFHTPDFDRPGSIIFLDEAQESEKIGSYVRFMKEEWKHVRVILSGSSMSRIFRGSTRVPVGRYRPWHVTPFVFDEFLSASSNVVLQKANATFQADPRVGLIEGATHSAMLALLDTYLLVGGLPAVVTTFFAQGDYRATRHAIYNAQEDDFVRKSSLHERAFFSRGLKGVANFIGMPAKYAHIHDSKNIAEKSLSELKAWNLVIEVEQKGMNSTSQHLPKRYLYDMGITQDMRDMPFPRLSLVTTTNEALRTQLGGLFENALLLQLIDEQTYFGDISGWRKGGSDGPEVDFVWRRNGLSIPIECKATQKVSLKHWSGLKQYLDATGERVGFLVTAAPFKVIKQSERVLINLPLYSASAATIQKCVEIFGP
jgi:predicted AAA+ superfamily ATPase